MYACLWADFTDSFVDSLQNSLLAHGKLGLQKRGTYTVFTYFVSLDHRSKFDKCSSDTHGHIYFLFVSLTPKVGRISDNAITGCISFSIGI